MKGKNKKHLAPTLVLKVINNFPLFSIAGIPSFSQDQLLQDEHRLPSPSPALGQTLSLVALLRNFKTFFYPNVVFGCLLLPCNFEHESL